MAKRRNINQYRVESFYLGRWVELFSETRDFCAGYMHAKRCDAPRNRMRVVRFNGTEDTIIQELNEVAEVSIGMIAGWPTPEQYEAAAERALNEAARIRLASMIRDKNRTSHT